MVEIQYLGNASYFQAPNRLWTFNVNMETCLYLGMSIKTLLFLNTYLDYMV